jgi:hypothetical protein
MVAQTSIFLLTTGIILHSSGYNRNVFYIGDLFSRTTTSIYYTSKVNRDSPVHKTRLPFDERQNPRDSPVHKVFVHKQELADAKTLHEGSSLQEWA